MALNGAMASLQQACMYEAVPSDVRSDMLSAENWNSVNMGAEPTESACCITQVA